MFSPQTQGIRRASRPSKQIIISAFATPKLSAIHPTLKKPIGPVPMQSVLVRLVIDTCDVTVKGDLHLKSQTFEASKNSSFYGKIS